MILPEILSWKFSDQPGMECRQRPDGSWETVKFPGGLPTQAQIDAWTSEYQDHKTYKDLVDAIDAHIQSVAAADKWDSRLTCAVRAGYPAPWQAKGIAFGQWMDACYAHGFQVEADVRAGLRAVPTKEQLIAELPAMVWP